MHSRRLSVSTSVPFPGPEVTSCISWTSFALTMGLRQSHLILSPSSFPCQKLRFCDSPCRSFLVMIKEALDSGEIFPKFLTLTLWIRAINLRESSQKLFPYILDLFFTFTY